VKLIETFRELIFVPYPEKEKQKLNMGWNSTVNMMPMQPSLPQFWTSFETFKAPGSSNANIATLMNRNVVNNSESGKK